MKLSLRFRKLSLFLHQVVTESELRRQPGQRSFFSIHSWLWSMNWDGYGGNIHSSAFTLIWCSRCWLFCFGAAETFNCLKLPFSWDSCCFPYRLSIRNFPTPTPTLWVTHDCLSHSRLISTDQHAIQFPFLQQFYAIDPCIGGFLWSHQILILRWFPFLELYIW